MRRSVRAGIVGAGWGANHARVIADLAAAAGPDPDVAVVAICSRRRDRSAALAAELGLPESAVETEWERLVRRADVDLVVNTAPDHLHHPVTLAAIAAGKHVFCDKPLAMTAAQAEDMLAGAEAAGVAHFTGFTWRFAPPVATLRRLLEEGALGPIRYLDAHFRIGPPLAGKEWQHDPTQRAGGVLSNLGVHLIDLARYLLRWTAPAPQARGDAAADPSTWRIWAARDMAGAVGAGDGTTSAAWMQLEVPPAVCVRLQASQTALLRAQDPVRVEVHGEHASAIGYANPLRPQTQRVVWLPRTSDPAQPVEPLAFPGGPPAPPTAALPSGGLLRPTIKHLYEAHILPRLGGAPLRADTPTFLDGLLAQRVLDAALRSIESGTWERP